MTLQLPPKPFYPSNVISEVVIALQEIDPHTPGTDPGTNLPYEDGLRIKRRRLNDTDTTQTVGVWPTTWSPDEDSIEMRGMPVPMPTVQRYPIVIEAWVLDGNEDEGFQMSAYLASLIRLKLVESVHLEVAFRHPDMEVPLPDGMKETVLRWGLVPPQHYESAMIGTQFGFLSTTTFYVDTQIN